VFGAVAHLLSLETELIFFDTASTDCETEAADDQAWRDPHGRVLNGGEASGGNGGENESVPDGPAATVGFCTHGKSKDSRRRLAPRHRREAGPVQKSSFVSLPRNTKRMS
jgi:hypothetical protein